MELRGIGVGFRLESRIIHHRFVANRPEGLAEFYRRLFGIEITADSDRWVGSYGKYGLIIVHRKEEDEPSWSEMEVEELAIFARRALHLGATVGDIEPGPDRRELHMADPERNRLILWERMPRDSFGPRRA